MFIFEIFVGLAVGAFLCLTPIPLFPLVFLKSTPSALAKFRQDKELWLAPLFLLGWLPFAALPLLILWGGYEKVGAHFSIATLVSMYSPLWADLVFKNRPPQRKP